MGRDSKKHNARDLVVSSYEVPRSFYIIGVQTGSKNISPVKHMDKLGLLVWYNEKHFSRKRRTPVNTDELVEKWRVAVVQLCLAHTKEDADRVEANIENLLTPLLSAPIKQVRDFAFKLANKLKADQSVPFLVWRPYEAWLSMVKEAPDSDVKELKTTIARQIADLVEEDVRPQLGEALVRSLQWRSAEQLEEAKLVIEKEKAAGRKPRLRGRESCLFLEAGGTEDEPGVCVQI